MNELREQIFEHYTGYFNAKPDQNLLTYPQLN